jgi:transposase-like protein
MTKVTEKSKKGKKQKVKGEVKVLKPEEYEGLSIDVRIETIQALIPLGLMHIEQELQKEVKRLAGERHERVEGGKENVRYGSNPGSVKIGGQSVPIRVPRVRNQRRDQEVPLETYSMFQDQSGSVDERLLKKVMYGISCRNYEEVAEDIPGAIGLSSSSVSRQFVEVSAKRLKEFQERDLSKLDIVVMWIDGKAFAEDSMVIALGSTMEGYKIPLGFVQAGTENGVVLGEFLEGLLDRGLNIEKGILVIIDGGKGLRSAVNKVFKKQALVQRCQWHKRENVLRYLPKSEQASMRKRLQRAYNTPKYIETRSALEEILKDLRVRNLSAAGSLEEGLEETLTLHRLGVFDQLGTSLKTTNCIESVMSQVDARCGKVTYWKNSLQKHRWLAASLIDIEPRLNRIRNYRHLHLLRESLQKDLGIKDNRRVA